MKIKFKRGFKKRFQIKSTIHLLKIGQVIQVHCCDHIVDGTIIRIDHKNYKITVKHQTVRYNGVKYKYTQIYYDLRLSRYIPKFKIL